MSYDDPDLFRCGYDVADQYRSGMWPELVSRPWKEVWESLVLEVESRCPGRSREEYGRALEQGFFDSR